MLQLLGSVSKPSVGTHFLNGHFISKESRSINDDRAVFRALLRKLRSKYIFVDAKSALSSIHQTEERYLAFTFDDGYADVFDSIVPVLEEFGLTGIFFINNLHVGLTGRDAENVINERLNSNLKKEFLTRDQVKAIAASGHIVGSHTQSHCRVNSRNDKQLYDEIARSRMEIEKITGRKCNCFAYPFGGLNDINEIALSIARENYDYIFSSIKGQGFFSFDKTVINRRHFEGNWPAAHINYFLSNR